MNQSQVLSQMLKENTGRALCDSGDHYGRNWQRNQKKNFKTEPKTMLRFRLREGDSGFWDTDRFDLNIYHFLNDHLQYEPEITRRLYNFACRKEWKDQPWLCIIHEFCEYNEWNYNTINTYNSEDALTQTIQYVQVPSQMIIFLQVHGGCDVRGGYSKPRAFQDAENALYNNARGVVSPANVKPENDLLSAEVPPVIPCWTSYDAGHRYEAGEDSYKNLNDYDGTNNPEDRGKGKLYIDEDGNGYCPITGGKLELYYY